MKKIVFLFTMLLSLCVVLAGCDLGGPVAPSTYKITFDSDGGSSVSAIVAEAGAGIAAPTDPTKEGFIFVGWYLGEVKYEFSVMPETNIELKAKWEEKQIIIPDPVEYTITLDVAGGDALEETTIKGEAGTTISLPTPTKEGYEFEGWYTTPREQVERLTEITLDENSVVWAKWKIKDGLSQEQIDRGIVAREVIGNHVVLLTAKGETLIAPVTDLWVQQNARLEAMMKLYNQKFNKQ
jgi:uncharacterized repeat protein (TIGR02543 family)